MSNELQTTVELTPEEKALLLNDLSKLTPDQRASLYTKVCQSLGLNPLTQPFGYIQLNGKLTLYAQRNCTDQLRDKKNVSVKIVSREKHGDLYIVTAAAKLPNGRVDESIGAVPISSLKGDNLANAIMKCETKAKRRVTLSICGLSFMDETEVETIKDAKLFKDEQPVAQLPKSENIKPVNTSPGVAEYHPPYQDDAPLPEPPITDDLDEYLGVDMSDISHQIDIYTIPFGKHTGRGLRDLGLAACQSYVTWIKDKNSSEGRGEIVGTVKEFIEMVDLYAKEFQHDADKEYWSKNGKSDRSEVRENQNQPD